MSPKRKTKADKIELDPELQAILDERMAAIGPAVHVIRAFPSKSNERKCSEEDTAKALILARGILSDAARYLGISRLTLMNWIKDSEFLTSIREEVGTVTLDFVEGQLRTHIEDNNLPAVIYYLKTQGRHRGWSQAPVNDNGDSAITIEGTAELFQRRIIGIRERSGTD